MALSCSAPRPPKCKGRGSPVPRGDFVHAFCAQHCRGFGVRRCDVNALCASRVVESCCAAGGCGKGTARVSSIAHVARPRRGSVSTGVRLQLFVSGCAVARVRVRRTELVRSFSTDDSGAARCVRLTKRSLNTRRLSQNENTRCRGTEMLNHVDGPPDSTNDTSTCDRRGGNIKTGSAAVR